jgi:hypothetical protein
VSADIPSLRITRDELLHARKRLALGASLDRAADDLAIEAGELDLLLWRYLIRHGRQDGIRAA